MAKTICITILIFMLCGCGSNRIVYRDRIKTVEIPIYQDPPKVAKPVKPTLPITTITKDSNMKETAEAYVNTIDRLSKYAEALEDALIPFCEGQ